MGKRRTGREMALKYLYQNEFRPIELAEGWALFQENVTMDKDVELFSRDLVKTCMVKRDSVDVLLKEFSKHWTLARMTVIDRNILRLGACELLYMKQTPPKVVINEWVEVSKKFSNADSPPFINGILDKLFKSSEAENKMSS
ncbi:MAG: transcription antitermination factor NusB [Nitrospinae bacterium CG11_big_fil_rev_8_21_14_0_20_45_15]|nr:MAG: transcription antitermination factor NusB [Nitrospinae bacterium CG11_big_fil_rev_8_21_14_0_20_45_15]